VGSAIGDTIGAALAAALLASLETVKRRLAPKTAARSLIGFFLPPSALLGLFHPHTEAPQQQDKAVTGRHKPRDICRCNTIWQAM
jgi:hypothetical protein